MSIRALVRAGTFALGASLLVAGFASDDAFAKKKKDNASASSAEMLTIETTKIASFDDVFGKVTDIQTKLGEIDANLLQANDSVTEALALSKGTPMADALEDLKAKADGKLTVAMEGTKPTLSVDDAVPDNVKTAVDAVNNAVSTWTETSTQVVSLKTDIDALVAEAKQMPGKTPDAVKESGLKPTEAPGVLKAVKNNVKATEQTADHAKSVGETVVSTLDTVKSLGG